MFASVLVAALSAIAGLALAVWTSYASAPLLLVKVEDTLTRAASAVLHPSSGALSLDESMLTLTAQELKVDKLPAGYRYQPLPYPLAASWDKSSLGVCQLQRWSRNIPNPKAPNYIDTDTTVDGMYGQFLASIQPPSAAARETKDAFAAYMATRKSLEQMEQMVRRDAGAEAAREWRQLRAETQQKYLELAAALQHTLNANSGTYAKALVAYANDAYRHNITCGSLDTREPAYTVIESLQEFRESAAATTSVSALAELLEFTGGAGTSKDSGVSLGTAEVAMSFRKVKLFNIQPGRWFSKEAILTFASGVSTDGRRFWGDEGLFPLMPVALLAVTEPVLKVKLSTEQAQQVRDLLSKRQALQVGAFKFDFSTPGLYRATSDDGTLSTELKLVAPRNEVVVLGVVSKRPDLRQ